MGLECAVRGVQGKGIYLDVKINGMPGKAGGHQYYPLFSVWASAAFLFNGGNLC
jgi:hypothetical protein